ncbi:MAG: hypothetical protein ACD_9C00157G0002 [uncultured bacterium]|nr:MAG: hypothetical protein ACD_9C00157G0002 [uncultured bacterium]
MVTVKVVWRSSGKAVCGSRVSLGFNSGMSEEILTDVSGEVDFEDALPGRHASIYVDGTEKFSGVLPDRKVIAI